MEIPSSPEAEEHLPKSHEEEARSRWQETVASHRKWAELGLAAGCMLLAPHALHGQEGESREVSESRREALQALQEADPSGERLSYIENRFPLHTRLDMVRESQKSSSPQEVQATPPQFINFERFNVPSELVAEFFSEKYFPKGSINGEVDAVVVHDTLAFSERLARKVDESGREIVEPATLRVYGNIQPTKDSINIFPHKELAGFKLNRIENFALALAYVLIHENAHLNDPLNDNALSLDERLDFLIELSKMYDRPGRPRDNYADSFYYQEDLRIEYERRMQEWWADRVEDWRMRPKQFKRDQPEVFAFVQKWIAKDDPTYDPVVALELSHVLFDAINEAYERGRRGGFDARF